MLFWPLAASIVDAAQLYHDYIMATVKPKLQGKQLSQIGSIDFTFTCHSHLSHFGYAIKGGCVFSFYLTPSLHSSTLLFSRPQPETDEKFAQYTNCIATFFWADGVNHMPPI